MFGVEPVTAISIIFGIIISLATVWIWGFNYSRSKNGYVKESTCQSRGHEMKETVKDFQEKVETQVTNLQQKTDESLQRIHEKVNDTNKNLAELTGLVKAHFN